jgi:hypothetical protein
MRLRRGSCRRVALAALIALAVPAAPAPATTLVLLVGDRAIVVAGDSMRTLANGSRESVCKIHHAGGAVFGLAGAVSAERFDGATIAAREIAAGGTLAEQAGRIAAALQESLAVIYKGTNAVVAQRELVAAHRGRPVTGFLAGLVDGKPQAWLVVVEAAPAPDGVTLTTRVEPVETGRRDRAVFLSPQHPEVIARADRLVGSRRRVPVAELVGAAEELMGVDLALEAKRPDAERRSGPPISIAVLDQAGFRFQTPGPCAGPRD